jgi:SAM-dependent methyltransferase
MRPSAVCKCALMSSSAIRTWGAQCSTSDAVQVISVRNWLAAVLGSWHAISVRRWSSALAFGGDVCQLSPTRLSSPMCFGTDHFDVVVSSECLEHTPRPTDAIAQMIGVLKPDGLLSLSTPNRVWQPIARLASRLEATSIRWIRELQFVSVDAIESCGAFVAAARGQHFVPF